VGTLDFSLLVDGLESEREQGITIDVAHRHLRLPSGRRAILADSPGHEQYTRNMAVASSTADVAILVVDATRGVREQTLRHATVCVLMGVSALVVAVNKLDASPEPAALFASIREELGHRLATLVGPAGMAGSAADVSFVAVSGVRGDNVTVVSSSLPTGDSATLLDALESAALAQDTRDSTARGTLRLPIQGVIRHDSRRFLTGRIARGSLSVGDHISVWSAGASVAPASPAVSATIVALRNPEDTSTASAGASISLQLDRDIDAGRGDMIVRASDVALPISRAHLATLIWLDGEPLDPTLSYLLRVGPLEVPARVDVVRHVVDLVTGEQEAGRPLQMNDIGVVEVTGDRAIILDSYSESHDTGGFILVDRLTGRTVAAGLSLHPLTRQSEVVRHSFAIDRSARERLNGVRSRVLWLTGLPGSGKSTIADEVEKQLFARGIRSYVLDGDTVRQTLSEDLGFSPQDRAENVRRVGRTAQLMMDAGLIVIVSLVSPFASDRALAREMFADSDFVEAFVDTPLDVCIERDPKGLYARAAASSDTQMTGVGQNYEIPVTPDIRLDGTAPVADAVESLLALLIRRL
jgi:bifunctional enzyme CysN/CysC